MFSSVLSSAVSFVWGLPLLFLLVGTGLYLLFLSRFLPFRAFSAAWKILFEKKSKYETAAGQISHFKALSNALAATVGMGNIAGVAVAVQQGGPGAIFWMWLAALVGMNTKFFECTLALMYRSKDYQGELQGGPMYVIEKALSKNFKPLAIAFAVFGLFGTTPLFNANQLSKHLFIAYEVPPYFSGLLMAAMMFYILKGGLQRLSKATAALVPSMCLLYVLCGLVILFINYERVPGAFVLIFKHALTGEAIWGGAYGTGIIAIMQIGLKRASFSNEAGIGTAPMAHGNAKTDEPVKEGLVAMLGPFIDTIVVCSITALVILTAVDPKYLSQGGGIALTMRAFENSLPLFGAPILSFVLVLFSISTSIGMANYNKKCWDYVFRGRAFLGEVSFRLWYCLGLLAATLLPMLDVINFMDLCFALMAIPNLIAVLILAPKVMHSLRRYFLENMS